MAAFISIVKYLNHQSSLRPSPAASSQASSAREPLNSLTFLASGTVKLSRIRPFCGRILLDHRLRINDLAVAASGENAAKLLNLTVPSAGLDQALLQTG